MGADEGREQGEKVETVEDDLMDDMPDDIQPVVVSPEDEVEAFTPRREKTPPIRFIYRPLAGKEESNYLTALDQAGQRIWRIKKVNYDMLAKHIVDADLYDRQMKKLDTSVPENWERVPSEIMADMASIVTGSDNVIAKRDDANVVGL